LDYEGHSGELENELFKAHYVYTPTITAAHTKTECFSAADLGVKP
jgi:hypothetical protein